MILRTRFYAFSFFLLVLMAGERPLTVLATLTTAPPQPSTPLFQPRTEAPRVAIYPPRGDDRYIGGGADNNVVVIAYVDFSCVECAQQHQVLRELYVGLKGQVAIIYRHFQARSPKYDAAHAAECTAEQLGQDGFDRFAEIFFMNQQTLLDLADPFPQLAQNLGADSKKFAQCMLSQRHTERIRQHAREAFEHAEAAPLLLVLNLRDAQVAILAGLQPSRYLEQVFKMMTEGRITPAGR